MEGEEGGNGMERGRRKGRGDVKHKEGREEGVKAEGEMRRRDGKYREGKREGRDEC